MRNGSPGFIVAAALTAAVSLAAPPAAAGEASRWDVGVAFTTIPLARDGSRERDAPTKWVPGGALWAAFHPNETLAFEAEVAGYWPQEELGRLGATPRAKRLAVAGPRLGRDFGKVAAGVKIRAGMLWSDFDLVTFPPVERHEEDFVLDLGGVLEYRPAEHWLLRLDVGDLLVPSDDRASHPFGEHNLRLSLGVALSP